MLTAAVVPVATVPIDKLFAGPVAPVAPALPVAPVLPVGPVAPVGPIGTTNDRVCDGAVPLMVTAAVAPVDTVPIDKLFAGPVAPVAPVLPVAPVGPIGRTNASVCDGAVPLMVTAAVAPVVTLAIDKEFAGPVKPVKPRGNPKSNLEAYDVPELTTDADAVGASVVTVPT